MKTMFSCPKCLDRTISLRAKLNASAWQPVACASCGALLVVSRGAVLGALAVTLLAAVALVFAASSISAAAALCVIFVMALSGCVYSFGFAPLEQLAQPEPRPRWTALFRP
jgi:ribosomal protein S27E